MKIGDLVEFRPDIREGEQHPREVDFTKKYIIENYTDHEKSPYVRFLGEHGDYPISMLVNAIDQNSKELRKKLAECESCPCGDKGYYVVDGPNFYTGDSERQQEQCEFCYTNEKSRFKALEAYEEFNKLPIGKGDLE